MGRHHQRSERRLVRAAVCSGVVGVGILQAALPALAAPAAPAAAADSATPCAATAEAS